MASIATKTKHETKLPETQTTFTSKAEVEAYLSGAHITCLICGKSFRALGGHLSQRHDLTVREYRHQFGIPAKYALACDDFRAKSSVRLKQLRAEGKIAKTPSEKTIATLLVYSRTRKKTAPVTRQESTQRLMKLIGKSSPWQQSDFDEFLRRIESGRTAPEVARDPDMPSQIALRKFMAKNEAFRRRYDALWEAVPFALQVRARKTGERYKDTLVALRTSGLAWNEVAKIMGVKPATAKAMWHAMQKKTPAV
jgi:predicted transcriptional regulator